MMMLQVFLLGTFAVFALGKQVPFVFETKGKPEKMLAVGRLPALGCISPFSVSGLMVDNTWNAYECKINETVVLENAKFMNESGLLQAGYNYFVIDGMTSSFAPIPKLIADE